MGQHEGSLWLSTKEKAAVALGARIVCSHGFPAPEQPVLLGMEGMLGTEPWELPTVWG